MTIPRLASQHDYGNTNIWIDPDFERSRNYTGYTQDQLYMVKDDAGWLSEFTQWALPGDPVWRITGGRGDDTLGAFAYDDTVVGGLGKDRLIGMDGDDLLVGDRRNSETEGDADTLDGDKGDDALFGGGGDDSLLGGEGDDSLVGNDGNDTMVGGAGDDVLAGGKGNDTYRLGSDDTIEEAAGEGIDTVLVLGQSSYTVQANIEHATYLFEGNGKLTGNGLNNRLTGSGGNDTLSGGGGHDTLSGAGGADSMAGGSGNDTYDVFEAGDRVVEGAGAGLDTVRTTLSDYALGANVENLVSLGAYGINGIGNSLGNTMTGNAVNDTLNGLDGNDALIGQGGNDSMLGGNGGDWMSGGAGVDWMRGEAGNDTMLGGADMDYLFGGDGNDAMEGGDFADVMNGEGGHDSMQGGRGNDTMQGGAGNDTLRGGDGSDRVRGNAGTDFLYGDGGNDIFVYGSTADSNTTAGRDIIQDFVIGRDRIDLSLIDANTTLAGNQAFQVVPSSTMFASPGDIKLIQGLAGTTIEGDVNGDGLADLSILVAGVTGMTASDFIL